MIILSNTTAQTVASGQTITLNNVIMHTGCGESYRSGSNAVRLRANGVYELSFNGNVSSATASAPVQLTIFVSGIPLPETTMISTPSTANVANHVGTLTAVRNCCGDFDRVTVVNNGTNPITIGANASLFIKRVA